MELLLPQSLDFYRQHSQEYAKLSASLLESGYVDLSNPQVKGNADLTNWLKALAPVRRGSRSTVGNWNGRPRDIDLGERREQDSRKALEHLELFCQKVSLGLDAMTFERR